MAWIHLTSQGQLEEAINLSEAKPQLFFKHSTRCIISKMALQAFESSRVLDSGAADFYLLDLLNYRTISNEITNRLNIIHQSPQAIMLSKNEVIYSETHDRIDGLRIQQILDSI